MTCSHHDIPPAHHVRLIQNKHIHHLNMSYFNEMMKILALYQPNMSWRYIMVRTCHTSMRWWRYLLCINLTHDIRPAHHVRLIQSKYLHHLIEVWHVLTMIYLQLIILGWYKASMFCINLTWWAAGISWWEHVILQWDDEDTCFVST
jgi:hypothetical protein